MKWVLWPNAPIIGGWAVLFTPRKYIFDYNVVEMMIMMIMMKKMMVMMMMMMMMNGFDGRPIYQTKWAKAISLSPHYNSFEFAPHYILLHPTIIH